MLLSNSLFFVLSTDKDNKYPLFCKVQVIDGETSYNVNRILSKYITLSKDKVLNTDGKFSYDCLKDRINVRNIKVDYDDEHHRLYWLNTIVGDLKNNITGIYHGVTKRALPLFLKEQEYRFNHRNTGRSFYDKIRKYILHSSPMSRKSIITVLNLSEPYFTCV